MTSLRPRTGIHLGAALALASALSSLSACGSSHTAPSDGATSDPDAGAGAACRPGDLVVVEMPGVTGRSLHASGDRWGVTFTHGRFEAFSIVDGSTGAAIPVLDDYSTGMLSIGLEDGFLVLYGGEAIYLDRDGARRGAIPISGWLAVGERGFVPLEDGGDRIYGWLTERASSGETQARLVSLPRTPEGAIETLPLVLAAPPLAFAAAPGGRVLVVEGDAGGVEPPRARELVVAAGGVTTISDAPLSGGLAAIAAAASDGEGAWVLSGALRTADAAQLSPRVARIAGGATETLEVAGAPEMAEYFVSGLTRDADGTIRATFASHDRPIALVTIAPAATARVADVGETFRGTAPALARGAAGCHGVLLGLGGGGMVGGGILADTSLVVRVLP